MLYTEKDALQSLRAVNYLRYSDHKQSEGTSIETQKTHCDEYIYKAGMVHVADYVDEAKSASKGVAGRDDFLRILEDAPKGLFDVVLIYKFSRVFRNQYEAHFYEHELKKHGIKLISVTEKIDDSLEGQMMKGVIHAFNEFTAKTISAHVTDGMWTLAKKGYFLNSVPLFGFDAIHDGKEGRRYHPNADEAPIVKELFDLFADGVSIAGIARIFFDKGYKTRQYKKRGGNYFGEKTLRDMLINEHYIGTYLYTSKKTGKSLRIEKNHPAIIDEKTFLTAQARLAESTARTPKPRSNKNRTFYLTGKIKCGYCGDVNCTGSTGRWTYKGETHYRPYYHCANRRQSRGSCPANTIRKDEIETHVFRAIREHVLNAGAIKEIAAFIFSLTGDKFENKDLAKLKAKEKQLMDQLSSAMESLLNMNLKPVAKRAYERKTEEIGDELERITLDIKRAEIAEQNSISAEKIESYLLSLMTDIEKHDDQPEVLKMIIDKLVDKVIVTNKDVEIFLHVSLSELSAYNGGIGLPVWALSVRNSRAEIKRNKAGN